MVNQYLKPVITIPSSLNITNITTSFPMVVSVELGNTVTEYNSYIVGMLIKLMVPQSYKMYQANGLQGTITAISGSDFTLDIDSSQFDTFTVPSGNEEQPATISPAGSRNYQYNNTSKLVPFQALNNVGN